MDCLFELKMGITDTIALLALLAVGLSAFYAHWSWRESKKANNISLLGHKKEIYDAFYELKMHMTQNAQFAELGEVSKFYYHQKNAKIYLPSDLAEDIEKYYDACFWISDIHRRDGGLTEENAADFKPHIYNEKQLAPKIEKALVRLLHEVGT
ncbi:hypothetical protein [Halovibrio sp. HP20-50]|uniref:hypothetical protein n=1 Tax=Halovibrio sp. HP20-59 TaxID=3080275 RepID=UPI00294B1498|nr:hypothetical protein [Halovibrio sp. HP20-59]MEA2117716.1 hypothetical protein [Halovibrio sp. HP20-59]